MKKTLIISATALLFAGTAQADLQVFQEFTAEGAGLSIDAVGLNTNTEGFVQAEIPVNATIEAAYLYSASVWSFSSLADVEFDGNTLTSDATSRVDVGLQDANPASENRWDVTSIVQSKYDGLGGIYDFSVVETGNLDGEVLAVLYSVAGDPVKTSFIFDGELATTGDSFDINLGDDYDGSDAIMSLGISFGFQGNDQFTQVDINGERMTSSAGGQDDGFGSNGGLITAGGVGDSPALPADPNAGPNGDPTYDDELYNIAPFLDVGDNLISISTLNPSNDDNVFFLGFTVNGEASIDPIDPDPVNPVPEPTTLLLFGTGLAGLAGIRRKKRN